jgi:type VI secretion system secreted protein Hcp
MMVMGGLALAAAPVPALAQQFSYFMQISGVSGESTDAQHANWIDITSMSGNVQQPQAPTFSFSTRQSTASPPLLLAAASGQVFSTATLAVRRGTPGNPDYLKYTMTNVAVVSDGFSGGSGVPLEQFQLNFSTLQIEYRQQRPDGSYAPPIITCWDFVAGAPCS